MSDLSRPPKGLSSNQSDGLPALSEEQFDWMAKRVRQLAGITISPHKHLLVQSRIQRRLRHLGLPDFQAYLTYLDGPAGDEEAVAFCNALTTNLTSFFREKHHFDFLTKEIVEKRIASDGSLKIWSAGCSTGQEPYSIAMTLSAIGITVRPKQIQLDATDIDTNVLETAKKAHYDLDDLSAIPEEMRRFFRRSKNNGFEIVEPIRNMINFRNGNLMQDWPEPGTYDVIFCRNVLIYFDADTKGNLIRQFTASLKPGGTLFLGHSESIMNLNVPLKMTGRTTFKRLP